ncbi:IclR family transcriptional regulator [Pseudooceanicola algae]|uniref:Transcriptional regulator KdgR n=1 Tax=Pseudooceanicola algae TaxID=1537215 RepID=A0A418SFN9_9RHOB|nr:IclR family transcriptional regulator [Pseudooceanicola algae]QPM91509.1 Transcriptional regulator KdgR [Pseudooceanicola algae]
MNDTPRGTTATSGPITGQPRVDSTLSKGLLILEVLTSTDRPKGVTELSRDLGLTKSNVFRLLQTLCVLGYVRHTADKQYEATLKTWQVGRSVVENLNLRELAAPQMRMLSDETGEAVYLAVPEARTVIYIDKIESRQPIRTWNPVGGAAPIHAVSTGKAILAANYDRFRPLLETGMDRHTDRTLTDLAALDAEIATIRARGYAIDTGEFRERVHGYGAAITLPDGFVTAAIGISLPDLNLPADAEARYGALVRHAAAEVTARLARV